MLTDKPVIFVWAPVVRLGTPVILNSVATEESWARPEAVAEVVHEIVARGERIPLRVPLGPDAWGMIKAEVEQIGRELDEVKELSESVGDPRQLGSIDFLRNAQS